jgi:hypothetical protein
MLCPAPWTTRFGALFQIAPASDYKVRECLGAYARKQRVVASPW